MHFHLLEMLRQLRLVLDFRRFFVYTFLILQLQLRLRGVQAWMNLAKGGVGLQGGQARNKRLTLILVCNFFAPAISFSSSAFLIVKGLASSAALFFCATNT